LRLFPLDSLPFAQQPNGRTYLAFKFHRRNTTRTAINDDNLGFDHVVRNKWKKKGILNIATWNRMGKEA
jgi:hypothetical protein